MEEKLQKKVLKWEEEIKILEEVRRAFKGFSKLKDEKAVKGEIDGASEVVLALLDEHKWVNIDWKDLKRSKASRIEGIEKLDKKIEDRRILIDEVNTFEKENGGSFMENGKLVAPLRDWEVEIESCRPDSIYYHWAYGRLEVILEEDGYIYLRVLDKKGCAHEWLKKNNAIIELAGE
ncbi:MAG: hypothetical protein RR472_02225, partial [Anaerovoracaceae bacterium]